jgi:hypothetical protein
MWSATVDVDDVDVVAHVAVDVDGSVPKRPVQCVERPRLDPDPQPRVTTRRRETT